MLKRKAAVSLAENFSWLQLKAWGQNKEATKWRLKLWHQRAVSPYINESQAMLASRPITLNKVIRRQGTKCYLCTSCHAVCKVQVQAQWESYKEEQKNKMYELITSRDLQEVSETRKNKTRSKILLQELSRCEIQYTNALCILNCYLMRWVDVFKRGGEKKWCMKQPHYITVSRLDRRTYYTHTHTHTCLL
jgi:hypothetical protein